MLTPKVVYALGTPLTSIGQLTKSELRELEAAVSSGILSKGVGGPYPALKTVYAKPGTDFKVERDRVIEILGNYILDNLSEAGYDGRPSKLFRTCEYGIQT